jgi:hypothetical protein
VSFFVSHASFCPALSYFMVLFSRLIPSSLPFFFPVFLFRFASPNGSKGNFTGQKMNKKQMKKNESQKMKKESKRKGTRGKKREREKRDSYIYI